MHSTHPQPSKVFSKQQLRSLDKHLVKKLHTQPLHAGIEARLAKVAFDDKDMASALQVVTLGFSAIALIVSSAAWVKADADAAPAVLVAILLAIVFLFLAYVVASYRSISSSASAVLEYRVAHVAERVESLQADSEG